MADSFGHGGPNTWPKPRPGPGLTRSIARRSTLRARDGPACVKRSSSAAGLVPWAPLAVIWPTAPTVSVAGMICWGEANLWVGCSQCLYCMGKGSNQEPT